MRKLRNWLKFNAIIVLISVLGIVAVVGYGFYLWNSQQGKHVTIGSEIGDSSSKYMYITYNGKQYQYNTQITTLLYAGIDSKDEMVATTKYGDKPRADSIFLIVLNRLDKKMTVVSINRDTMTTIRRFSINGTDLGTYTSHIGYAYSYGDGGKASCLNLQEAVSTLFNNIPIDEYIVTNQTSIPYLNNLVDGVTVTVPNDDLVELYPTMTKGRQVNLDDSNVTDYLHYRDTNKDFSNVSRLERQEAYMSAFFEKLQSQINQNEYTSLWDRFQETNDYLQTSITKSKYIDLINLIDIVKFSDDYYSIQGENKVNIGDSHDEFYYDETALKEKILELFYKEI